MGRLKNKAGFSFNILLHNYNLLTLKSLQILLRLQMGIQTNTGHNLNTRPSFHMVNSVTCMNIGTSLEKAIKRVLNKL